MISILVTSINVFFQLLYYLILARCFLSWIPNMGNNPIGSFIYNITEPILAPIRNIVYKSPLGGPGMGLDFSPVIACFVLMGLRAIIIGILL